MRPDEVEIVQDRQDSTAFAVPTLDDVAAMLQQQPYAVVSTIRPSGTVQSTLVNVGLYDDGIGFTTSGHTVKEYNLKRNPACTVASRISLLNECFY